MGDSRHRWLARLLIRGPDAAYVRAELEESLERDLERGVRGARAHLRYVVNVIGSSLSLWRARWRWHRRQGQRDDIAIARRDDAGVGPRDVIDRNARDRRGPGWLAFSWLDVKLGLRMVVKQPALTAVAVFALAIGIPTGLMPMHLVDAVEAPLPVSGGERIQLLRYWNTSTNGPEGPTFYEYERWRASLASFESLGAVSMGGYNLETDGGAGATIPGAELTASTFELLRARPLLGRMLTAEDERIGGPPVVVIGYDVWQARLAGDRGVLGRTLRLGGAPYTIVGVMPEGFRFPARHQLWLPLRERPAAEPGRGRPLRIVGRLVDGVSSSQAQAELTTLGNALTVEFPETHERLRVEVVPSSFIALFGLPRGGFRAMPEFYLTQLLTLLLLVVACTNVGLLVYARTATRTSELAVRTALGAGRARIVAQVFTESLVLAVLAAACGLLLIDGLAALIPTRIAQVLPYWVDPGVKLPTVLWAMGLAGLSAVVAGVVPALRVTGRSVQQTIQRARASRGGFRFGGVTSGLVVADVALSVFVVGMAVGLADFLRDAWTEQAESVGIADDEYLSARLSLPWVEPAGGARAADRAEFAARVATTHRTLVERLEAEPGVRGVAVATVLPRMQHPARTIEIEGEHVSGDSEGREVKTAVVGIGFFDGFDKPILSGRGFTTADLADDALPVAIVNRPFVERVLGGRNPIGRRIRYTASRNDVESPWFEIVGVVDRLGMDIMNGENDAGVYRPLAPGQANSLRLAIHVGPDPDSFAPRLREIAADVDATAVVSETMALDRVFEGDWYFLAGFAIGGVLLVGILLALAASGIYAMLSFAVARRTREIGIRTALGAKRATIAYTVAKRALMQIALGVLVGTAPLAVLVSLTQTGLAETAGAFAFSLIPGIAILIGVGLLACTAPTLRALRINPTEALKSGG